MAKSKKTKIHKKIDGQLLQLNKKFSDLKMKQKDKITGWVYEEYRKYVTEYDKVPDLLADEQIVEVVIDKINEVNEKSYIRSLKEKVIQSGMRQTKKDVFESPDGLYLKMVYGNRIFFPYKPITETRDLPVDAKYAPLLERILGEKVLAQVSGEKIFITLRNKYAINFWCWKK